MRLCFLVGMVALPNPVNVEAAFKQQFAAFMSQGFTPFMSALKIWPNNNGYAAMYGDKWKNDPEVLAFIADTKKANAKPVPTKEDLALELIDRAKSMEDDDYVKATRVAAEMLGYMPKAGDINISQNNTVNERVMIVKDKGTDEQWEERLARQQAKLIEHAG